ncbi:hypothetical protein WJX84_000276 [Apatococcus fuscideae]|uniref:Guanylate cyclase domain-containing protein n=1 Tax=Apatococcus fuscideae TaxID=2026836 RepID=A0AAW1TLC3_9CHLO
MARGCSLVRNAPALAPGALPVDTSIIYSPDLDEPAQRQALLDLYAYTSGPSWTVQNVLANSLQEASLAAAPNAAAALEIERATFLAEQLSKFKWGTPGVSYCLWVGVTCCPTASPITAATCREPFLQSVARLDMGSFSLNGTLPPSLGDLGDLQVINWVNNTDLVGSLPNSLVNTKLYAIYATNTRLCYASPHCPLNGPPVPGSHLPSFIYADLGYQGFRNSDGSTIDCPLLSLSMTPATTKLYTRVLVAPSYYGYADCRCDDARQTLQVQWQQSELKYSATCTTHPANNTTEIVIITVCVGILVLCLLGSCITFVWWKFSVANELRRLGANASKRKHPPGCCPGHEDAEVTLVHTDIEGSTDIWEWDHRVMQKALNRHDSTLRTLTGRYFGYEVTTEGDSFTMAFHDPIDAVAWCMHVQQRLLKEEWPMRLGEHAAARIVTAGDLEDDPSNRQTIFNGLRVRMAVNTGVPSKIKIHHVTKQAEYQGHLLNELEAIGSLPSGGQVLISATTYQRICGRLDELRLPALQKAYALPSDSPGMARRMAHKRPAGLWSSFQMAMSMTKRSASCSMSGPSSHSHNSQQGHNAPPENSYTQRLISMQTITRAPISRQNSGSQDKKNETERRRGFAMHDDLDFTYRISDRDAALPMLIDMGYHKLAGLKTDKADQSWYMPGVQIIQIVPWHLRLRTVLFPRLVSEAQVYPGFFDAPGSHLALLPPRLCKGPLEATIAFCCIDRLRELGAIDSGLAERACSLYTDVVRSTLFINKGYECQEKEGLFMMAFATPVSALEWALTLQLALTKVAWPEELLATEIGRLVKDPSTGSILFAGLRAKCSIFHGTMSKIVPHTTTGRADYFGLAVNRAARFMGAAVGGQVLAERGVVEEVASIWASSGRKTHGRRPSAERSRHRSALLVLPQPDYDEETSGTIRRQLQQAGDVLSSVASLRTASMPHISRQLLAPPVPDPRELPRRNLNWTDHSLDARVLRGPRRSLSMSAEHMRMSERAAANRNGLRSQADLNYEVWRHAAQQRSKSCTGGPSRRASDLQRPGEGSLHPAKKLQSRARRKSQRLFPGLLSSDTSPLARYEREQLATSTAAAQKAPTLLQQKQCQLFLENKREQVHERQQQRGTEQPFWAVSG